MMTLEQLRESARRMSAAINAAGVPYTDDELIALYEGRSGKFTARSVERDSRLMATALAWLYAYSGQHQFASSVRAQFASRYAISDAQAASVCNLIVAAIRKGDSLLRYGWN